MALIASELPRILNVRVRIRVHIIGIGVVIITPVSWPQRGWRTIVGSVIGRRIIINH